MERRREEIKKKGYKIRENVRKKNGKKKGRGEEGRKGENEGRKGIKAGKEEKRKGV